MPAGSGPTGGRWTDGAGAGASVARPRSPAPHLPIVPIAAAGPLSPGGLTIIPHTGIDPLDPLDPLDPQNLNKPLSPAEQQSIADTMNTILAGKPQDLASLFPQYYRNDPDPNTGARLPLGGNYTTHYVRSPISPPGTARIVTEDGGSVYYTRAFPA